MKCPNCGQEVEKYYFFCPNCGENIDESNEQACGSQEETHGSNYQYTQEAPHFDYAEYAKKKILGYHTDGYYLASCILTTVAWSLGLMHKQFNILVLIGIIFSWVLYSNSQKGKVDKSTLEATYILNKIAYIIDWIVTGLILVVGVIIAFVIDEIIEYFDIDSLSYSFSFLKSLTASGVIFITVGFTIILVLINLFISRPLLQFSKSLYDSAMKNKLKLESVMESIAALRVDGILYSVLAVVSLLTLDVSWIMLCGCRAATRFIDIRLISKYFPGYVEKY